VIQIIISQVSCWLVMIYRPFKSKVMNGVQIINEICITTAYAMSSLFVIDSGLSINIHVWLVQSCVYASYIFHMGLIGFNLVKFILKWILEKRRAVQTEEDLTRLNERNIDHLEASSNIVL
jgi:hypothetical protein